MMSNKELVTVIMSAYNSQNTIEKSINSLLVQTYKNIEIIFLINKVMLLRSVASPHKKKAFNKYLEAK